jgi:hypothetical protein
MLRTRRQKITFATALLLLATDVALWGATGWNFLTRQQIPVQRVDELLGTTYVEWQSVFMVGLDIAGPAALAVLLLAATLLFAFRPRTAPNS